jgi:flavin-dependent thymidylate synthase
MKVTLFDYTGAGTMDPASYAAAILLYTKSTRLEMSPGLLKEFKEISNEEKIKQLKIMSTTNPGSWEFISFSFLIEGVTRAFTHQLVRTRHASYAQQSLRVLDISEGTGWNYSTGPSIKSNLANAKVYTETMNMIDLTYKFIIKNGGNIEDARGILPTNILTNINMKIDMRNFINMARKRQSLRVQDEYRNVIDLMITKVEKVYPWFHIFYKSDEMKAHKELSLMIEENPKLTPEEKKEIYKKLDIIKGEY